MYIDMLSRFLAWRLRCTSTDNGYRRRRFVMVRGLVGAFATAPLDGPGSVAAS